ncbi:MAG: hypothetical protein D3909_00100 [Candidatus Electrothrix sp. ATG1]|nr:hypothetical protein [Candidatus Electrothrix sp. ATG1]MCI5207533.1 hypothetical protein [Candidatus Electrothrix sp. ATG2]
MKRAYCQVAHKVLPLFALFLTLGCAPTTALSDCDHDQPQHENGVTLPDFGFSINGACNEVSSGEPEPEDELLQDIEEPLEDPSSDLAATIEETQQTS